MANEVTIVVEPDGTARHLVNKDSEQFGSDIGPRIATQRASHVETWNDLSDKARYSVVQKNNTEITAYAIANYFWVDLLPVGGPVLGPYNDYETAIETEILWLQRFNLPKPANKEGSEDVTTDN